MKLYKINRWDFKIEEIEATRITESSFFSLDRNGKERREALASNYNNHFLTFEDAKNHLIGREESNLMESRRKVIVYEQRVAEAKNLMPKL